MKKRILSLALTLCMLASLMPGFTVPAAAADETVYPYYVITTGAAETGNYYVYKQAKSEDPFAAFISSADAESGTCYSTAAAAVSAITAEVTSGSGSATLQFGLTGTDVSATGTLDINSNFVDLGTSGTYTLKGNLSGNGDYTVYLNGASAAVDGAVLRSTYHGPAICNNGGGSITIADGTVENTGDGRAIENYASGSTVISGGTVQTTEGIVIFNSGSGSISISGGSMQTTVSGSNGNVIYNGTGAGDITITGGTLTSVGCVGVISNNGGDIEISGGTLEDTGTGRVIYNDGSGSITVRGGKLLSAGNRAISNKGAGTVSISGSEWNESEGTGTLVRTDCAEGGAIDSDAGKIFISGGTVAAKTITVYADAGIDISGGSIEASEGVALMLRASDCHISDGAVTANNTAAADGEARSFNTIPGAIWLTDFMTRDAKLYISGGTITNTAEGCPAIYNLSSHGLYPDYSPYTSEIYLSGAPSISGDAAIWTDAAIHAGDGTDAYTGDALTLEYGGGITAGATVAVDSVTSDNDALFSIANEDYYLAPNESADKLIISEAAGIVYPYYVVTEGEDESDYIYVYKQPGSADGFAAFTASADAESGSCYSTVTAAMSAITSDVSTGSATLRFGLTGTDRGAAGTLAPGANINLGSDGTYTIKGNLSAGIRLSGASAVIDGANVQYNSGSAILNSGGGSVTVTGGAVRAQAPMSRAIENRGGGSVTVSGGTVYSDKEYAIFNTSTAAGAIYISGSKWDEASGTGTLVRSGAGSSLYSEKAVYISGGTLLGVGFTVQSCAAGTVYMSGGSIEATAGVALAVVDATAYISGGTITAANAAAPSGRSPGAILNTDGGKVYLSGGSVTNTVSGCPAIYNGADLYLSGTPSVSGAADIWTNTAIHAGDGTDSYTGDALTLEYGGSFTGGTTVAVDGVADNGELFAVANPGYYLAPGEGGGELIISEIAGSWLDDGNYSTAWYDADPSATRFTVSTAADLAGLARLVNHRTDSFSGDTITLAGNINICAHEWTPIGSESNPFSGTFDGSGKTISGLFIDESSDDDQGLFGYIDSGAVKALTVSGSVTGADRVGGVAGSCEASTIENCVSACTVHSSGRYAGGIAGLTYFTTVDGCVNTGAVSVEGGYSGGIAGNAIVTDVINCSNSGAVSTEGSYAGGIAGQNAGNVKNCYNTGAVTGTYGGGVAGNNEGFAENCYNTGAVTGTDSGGVAGDNAADGTVTGCCWLSGSSPSCVGNPYFYGALFSCGTFSAAGAITAGTDENCGAGQTLSYGTALLSALNKWVLTTNGANFLEWTADGKNVNGGYPVFGALHAQRLITGQPGTNNAYTVTATQAAGIDRSYQWSRFVAADAEASLDLGYFAYGTAMTNARPHGFGLSDEDHEYRYGHSAWALNDGVYTSGAQGTGYSFSAMSIPFTVAEGEGISFEWKVSSEEDCDYLSAGLLSCSGGSYAPANGTFVGSISGETDWAEINYSNLPAGSYYLVFVYTKDGDGDDGDDCGYVRSAGTYTLLPGNTGAQLDRTGRTEGDLLRCNVSYSDGVVLVSDKIAFTPLAVVTNSLTGVTTSNSAASTVLNGTYTATLSPANSGYNMTVTVTMGGTDITSSAYNSATQAVSIANVTGDIVITAAASAPAGGGHTSSRTITVTETSSGLFSGSEGRIGAEANMTGAFSDSVEVKVTDTEQGASGFGLGAGNAVYPFDISLYIKGTDTKTEPKDGYAVTISLPVPDKLLEVKEQLSVAHRSDDGTVAALESQLKEINGVWYLVFEATEFSPYALVVNRVETYDEAAGLPYYAGSDGNAVFIGFAANGKYIAPSGAAVLFKENPKSFTDTGAHWAKDSIGFVTERELLSGTGDNRFSPDAGMTRAMFATVVGRLYERSFGAIETPDGRAFTDCNYGDYYGKYVDWAAEEGIIAGYGNDKFGPDDQVTREQMAVILYRFADFLGALPGETNTSLACPDADAISGWAQNAALYCQSTGIIAGRDGGSFVPQGKATRAEVSAIIRRFIETVLD